MDFNVDQTVFPSTVHNLIYSTARGIIPLETSLSVITDGEMRSSCTAYHGFIMAMLSDMYDNPNEYHLPVMLLEDYCKGQKINGLKQRFPSKTKGIIAQTRNAIKNYTMFMHLLGTHGKMEGDRLVVSSDILTEYDKSLRGSVRPVSVDNLFESMTRVGFVRNGNEITSIHFPNMFPALCALAKQAKKWSGFDFFAFRNLDFRNLNGKYNPTYDDYFRPLISDQKKRAYELHNFAVFQKAKHTISTFWKVDYKYKGAQVMCISSQANLGEHTLEIRVMGTYNRDDPALINDRLMKETPDFQKNVLRHVLRCDACSTSHLGMFVTVLGKRQRVCGGGAIAFKWKNPNDDDMAVIKRVIGLRCEIIDELKKRTS